MLCGALYLPPLIQWKWCGLPGLEVRRTEERRDQTPGGVLPLATFRTNCPCFPARTALPISTAQEQNLQSRILDMIIGRAEL